MADAVAVDVSVKARTPKVPADCLDLDDEIEFQHRAWTFQRWGRLGVLLFVIAAAAGFFGGGFFGNDTVKDSAGGLEIRHPRFARHDAAYDVRIKIQPALIRDGRVAVWIDQSLLEGLIVEGIMPEPASVEKSGEGVVFHFRSDQDGPLVIDGYLRTRGIGRGRGRAGVVGGPTVELKHLIFP